MNNCRGLIEFGRNEETLKSLLVALERVSLFLSTSVEKSEISQQVNFAQAFTEPHYFLFNLIYYLFMTIYQTYFSTKLKVVFRADWQMLIW